MNKLLLACVLLAVAVQGVRLQLQSEEVERSEVSGKGSTSVPHPYQALMALLLAFNPSVSEAFAVRPSTLRTGLSPGQHSSRTPAGVASSSPEVSGARYSRQGTKVSMGLFDGLAKAFENNETLGEAGPAGLKNKPTTQKVVWKGSGGKTKEQQAIAGTPLSRLAQSAGVEIRYSCKEGTCRTCDVKVNGKRTPACKAILGKAKETVIQYEDVKTMQKKAKAYELQLKAEKGGKKGGIFIETSSHALGRAIDIATRDTKSMPQKTKKDVLKLKANVWKKMKVSKARPGGAGSIKASLDARNGARAIVTQTEPVEDAWYC